MIEEERKESEVETQESLESEVEAEASCEVEDGNDVEEAAFVPDTNWEEVAQSRYEQIVRLQADFENFRRRMDRERDEIQGRVAERLLGDLLPVFDNLERALKYMPMEGEAKAWRVGVEMTLNGFLEALARLNVKPLEAVGRPFDPRFHEAVQQVDSEEPEGTIIEELQRGFQWNDRVLRASLVKVSTGTPSGQE